MRAAVRRFSFPTILALTMGSATFCLVAFGVLAASLITEFGVARWQIGALVTASSATSAVSSPWLGAATDRIGARRSVLATLALSTVAILAVALAPLFGLLVGAAVVTGIAQGASNPGTNKLIALHVAPGRQGVITGVKQSGVQVGTFLGGIALPGLSVLLGGWRGAVMAAAALSALGLVAAWLTVPADPGSAAGPHLVARDVRIPPLVRRIAVYGLLLGLGGSTMFTYLPLFAHEGLGYGTAVAGATVGVMGLVGIVARISWGRMAEARFGVTPTLRALALLAAAAAAALVLAPVVSPGLVWVGALVTGASASAWNSVGMLAIIQVMPAHLAGRGSGVVLLGFFSGLGVGAPLFGWSVDRLGTYGPGWAVAGLLFLGAWFLMRGDPS